MKRQEKFSIIYEDINIVAINKTSGISIGADRWDETQERLDKILNKLYETKLFTVHRIDRDTSGIVVFAKNEETHRQLSKNFENHSVKKEYIAIINGYPVWKETQCNLSLIPDGDKQHRTIVDKYRGKKCLTHFSLLNNAGNYSIVSAFPETGRTHQIRVHLASLGHPIVCDPLYGNIKPVYLSSFKRNWRGDPLEERPLLERLGLHAFRLTLPEIGILEAQIPRDMTSLIRQIEKAGN